MDRYTFLDGEAADLDHRAQMVMIALLRGCALIAPSVTDIWLRGIAGFVVNMAMTFQDVATDVLVTAVLGDLGMTPR